MKLKTLLKQITPLPWLEVAATDGDKWIGTKEGDDRIATLDGNTQPLDHVYLVHAANTLPELVAAAKHLQENWAKNLTEPMSRLNKALAKAEKVHHGIINTAQAHDSTITPAQGQALHQFLGCWNLSMPYHDIGSALNCGECNALYQMLLAFHAPEAARALLEAHAVGDDEGDDLDHVRIKAEMITRHGHDQK